jgi:hypothetical protein
MSPMLMFGNILAISNYPLFPSTEKIEYDDINES